MGILNSAYQLLDPVLPFDKYLDPRLGKQSTGILGGQPAQQPQYGAPPINPDGMRPTMGFPTMPQAPQMPQGGQQPPAGPQGKPARPSLLQTIWGVAAGYDPQTVREMYSDRAADREAQGRQRQAMEEQNRRIMEFAQTLDPRERAVFLADPKEWAKQTATRYGAANVSEGDSRVYGDPSAGAPVFTADTFEMSGDQAVRYGADGLKILGRRDPSFDELTGRQNADTGRMNAERPLGVGDGEDLIDPRTGKVIYRNPKNFAPPQSGGGASPDGIPPPPPGFQRVN